MIIQKWLTFYWATLYKLKSEAIAYRLNWSLKPNCKLRSCTLGEWHLWVIEIPYWV